MLSLFIAEQISKDLKLQCKCHTQIYVSGLLSKTVGLEQPQHQCGKDFPSTSDVEVTASSLHPSQLSPAAAHTFEPFTAHQAQPLQATRRVALISTLLHLHLQALIINSISCSATSPQLHTSIQTPFHTIATWH